MIKTIFFPLFAYIFFFIVICLIIYCAAVRDKFYKNYVRRKKDKYDILDR